jgi:hypothetical protein
MNKSPVQKMNISPSTIARCYGIHIETHLGNLLRWALDPATAWEMVNTLSDNNSSPPIAT